jgi:hypothetical protein
MYTYTRIDFEHFLPVFENIMPSTAGEWTNVLEGNAKEKSIARKDSNFVIVCDVTKYVTHGKKERRSFISAANVKLSGMPSTYIYIINAI